MNNDLDSEVLVGTTTQNIAQLKNRNEIPKMYSLLMHNSDIISFEFVLEVLSTVFDKNFEEAMALALIAHTQGKALIGVYTKKQAERKISKVDNLNSRAVENGEIGEPLVIEMKEE